jgi:electron transfer flavoprotein alpha subunit
MSNKIFVYIDQFKGQVHPASWEAMGAALTLAGKLGGSVTALVFGPQDVASQAVQYGASEVLYCDDASLVDYRPEPYTALVARLAREAAPAAIFFPTTSRGRELAAMSAIDLETGVIPDVIAIEVQDGKAVATRPVYAGKLLTKVVSDKLPQIFTTRTRAFAAAQANPAAAGAVTKVEPAMAEGAIATKVVEYTVSGGGVNLMDASVIVSGGRGVSVNPTLTPPAGLDDKQTEIWRAQQGFKLVGDLAQVLGGAVGASRAAVDAGYIPYEAQVGQTGKVVAPNLYIAAGISGAIQHQAGMRTSKVIVAINKDPEAPIFKMARFGVVGDLFAILPALTEAFKKKLGK